MRVMHMLAGIALFMVIALGLAGCGGGGGGETPPDYPAPVVDDAAKLVTYAPTASMNVTAIYANFVQADVASPKTFNQIFFTDPGNGTWQLIYNTNNLQFTQSANGKYLMRVYVMQNDGKPAVQVGSTFYVNLAITRDDGGDGGNTTPPPPPW